MRLLELSRSEKDPSRRVTDAASLHAELMNLGELSAAALADTMANPKPQAASFADQEQRLFSIVLAAPPEGEEGSAPTVPGSALLLETARRQALAQAIAELGAAPSFLATGALVVTLPPLTSAHDQAGLGARAALLIRTRWPEAIVSMATGRGALLGRTAVGEVVERATAALRRASQSVPERPISGVLVDVLSAKLLQGRFAQTPQPHGALLLSEERDADTSRPLLGKPTPCVGREAELGTLELQLATCIEESEARALLTTAPPGIGKSRLRHEFLQRAAIWGAMGCTLGGFSMADRSG